MATRTRLIGLCLITLAAVMSPRAAAFINGGKSEKVLRQEAYQRAVSRQQASFDSAEKQRDREQLGVLNTAILRAPNDAVARYQRGRLYCESVSLRDFTLARVDFDEAIRLKPDFAQAFFRRGLAHGNLQEYVRAVADLESSLKLAPSQEVRYRLTLFYYLSPDFSLRDLVKARELAEGLQSDDEAERGRNMAVLAAICAELGDFETAIKLETLRMKGRRDAAYPSNLAKFQQQITAIELKRQSAWSLFAIPKRSTPK